MGRGRDWNVDLIPKFLMANGEGDEGAIVEGGGHRAGPLLTMPSLQGSW